MPLEAGAPDGAPRPDTPVTRCSRGPAPGPDLERPPRCDLARTGLVRAWVLLAVQPGLLQQTQSRVLELAERGSVTSAQTSRHPRITPWGPAVPWGPRSAPSLEPPGLTCAQTGGPEQLPRVGRPGPRCGRTWGDGDCQNQPEVGASGRGELTGSSLRRSVETAPHTFPKGTCLLSGFSLA